MITVKIPANTRTASMLQKVSMNKTRYKSDADVKHNWPIHQATRQCLRNCILHTHRPFPRVSTALHELRIKT